MGYDDLFEHHGRRGYRGSYYNNHHDYYQDSYSEKYHGKFPGNQHFAIYILNRIWSNSKLRWLFVFLTILVVILAIILIIAILPLVTRLYDLLMQNGLKGIAETVTGFLDKLWSGTAK